MKQTNVQGLWDIFLDAYPEFFNEPLPKSGYFGDNRKDADQLAKLIAKGTKKAASHSLLGLQKRNESIPKIGDFFVVTDWEKHAKCIIRTSSVRLIPFFAITDEHALLEGEGNKSLNYWRKVHWDYYTRELAEFDKYPLESMIIVFEEFEVVFKP